MDRQSLVCGFGRNDANYKISGCPFYTRWASMLARCYNHKTHLQSPAYKDCTVAPVWSSFMAFKAWMERQPWEGNQLDKDLLFPGNRVYGPATCCFVTAQVNLFIVHSVTPKGALPKGVVRDGKTGPFVVHCNNPWSSLYEDQNEFLGAFWTSREAREAWRARKHQHACRLADEQQDPVVASALRVLFATGKERGKLKEAAAAAKNNRIYTTPK